MNSNNDVYIGEQNPIRAWLCSWYLSRCWGAMGLCLCRRRSGAVSSAEQKSSSSGLPALLAGELETRPWQRNSPYFFFLNKLMTFPICWETKQKTVEFWSCNLQIILNTTRQYLCRSIGCLWMPYFSEGYNLENMILVSEQFNLSSRCKFSADRHLSHK